MQERALAGSWALVARGRTGGSDNTKPRSIRRGLHRIHCGDKESPYLPCRTSLQGTSSLLEHTDLVAAERGASPGKAELRLPRRRCDIARWRGAPNNPHDPSLRYLQARTLLSPQWRSLRMEVARQVRLRAVPDPAAPVAVLGDPRLPLGAEREDPAGCFDEAV